MNNDYKYGVCKCENVYGCVKPKIEHLVEFDDYIEAYKFYISLISNSESYFDMKDWWIVFIQKSDNTIVQFDRFKFESKTRRYVKLD